MVPMRSSRFCREFTEKEVKEAIKKELVSLSSSGHEVYDPVPVRLRSREEQSKSLNQHGSLVLDQMFSRLNSLERVSLRSSHTPQATTLKLVLMMSQIHKWHLAVSDVASALLNTLVDESKGLIYVQALKRLSTLSLLSGTQTSALGLRDSPRSRQIHLTQLLQKMILFFK